MLTDCAKKRWLILGSVTFVGVCSLPLVLRKNTEVQDRALGAMNQNPNKVAKVSRGERLSQEQGHSHSRYRDREYLATLSRRELKQLGETLGQTDRELGMILLELLAVDFGRMDSFATGFFEGWAKNDPKGALSFIANFGNQEQLEFKSQAHLVARIWAEKEPSSASDFLKHMYEVNGQRKEQIGDVLTSAVNVWSRKAPKDAFQFLRTTAKEYREGPVLTYLAEYWANVNPIEALEQAKLADLTPLESNLLMDGVLRSWSESDPELTAAWFLEGVENEEQKYLGQAAETIARNLFETTTVDAVVEWAQQIQDKDVRKEALVGAALMWKTGVGDKSPEKVLGAFTQGLAAGDLVYQDALFESASAMADSKPEVIAEWLNGQEQFSELTDPVVHGLVSTLSGSAPFEVVLGWSGVIVQSELRNRQQISILTDWALQDKEGYLSWVESNQESLSESVIQALSF